MWARHEAYIREAYTLEIYTLEDYMLEAYITVGQRSSLKSACSCIPGLTASAALCQVMSPFGYWDISFKLTLTGLL